MGRETIRVQAASGQVGLDLRFGAADFRLKSADIEALVEGDVEYSHDQLRPIVETGGSYVRILQDAAGLLFPPYRATEWDLKLSTRYPMDLAIAAGAFRGEFDLSGVPLRRLRLKTGAAKGRVLFNRENPEDLRDLVVSTGASTFEMDGLLKANFQNLYFEGGAGSYRLNFSGALRRTVHADVRAGLSSIIIELPRQIPARIREGGVMSSAAGGGLAGNREYTNKTFSEGEPYLELTARIGLGSLEIVEIDE